MRSFENPEVLSLFVNWILKIYVSIMNPVIYFILCSCIISYIVCLLINTESKLNGKFNIKNLKQHFVQWRKDIKARFSEGKVVEISKNWFFKAKPYLWKCRYLIIWYVLLKSALYLVTLLFWGINKLNIIIPWWCSDIENKLLWRGSLYAFILFLIAPIFITFCFWNKFVRNIWIFIYILWICLVLVWWFLSLWCPAV